jgi:hypothetical protein
MERIGKDKRMDYGVIMAGRIDDMVCSNQTGFSLCLCTSTEE